MGSLTKGLIGKEDIDIAHDELYPSTFSRLNSVGSTITLTSFPDIWKTHQGTINCKNYSSGTQVGATIAAALSAGTTCRAFYLDAGEWIISTNHDWSSYTTSQWIFAPGAYLTIGAGCTVTFPYSASIVAQPNQQIFSGSGAIAFSYGGAVYPGWWGAAGNGTTNDAAALASALASGIKVLDGCGLTYKIGSGITVPADVILRDINLTSSTAGLNMVTVSTGSQLRRVKITGSGTVSTTERGVYGSSVNDVVFDDVEISNITYGVHAASCKRWKGTIYVHDIVGTIGASEGYGVLLETSSYCELKIMAEDIRRHAVYLSSGAQYNNIHVTTDGCGNYAVQLYATLAQDAVSYNRIRGIFANLTEDTASQSGAVSISQKAHYNDISVSVTGSANTHLAIFVEGASDGVSPVPIGNSIHDCQIYGQFNGAYVVGAQNADRTLIINNVIQAYATAQVISLNTAGARTITHGGYIYGNLIDAQAENIHGIYSEITDVPSFIGINDIRNNGLGNRVSDATSGKREGWSKEYHGTTVISNVDATNSKSAAITFPESLVNPRLSGASTAHSVTAVGYFPVHFSSVTTAGADVTVYNSHVALQNITVTWVAVGD